MTADGKEGVAFGLYTTTGRAVIFLAPLMFSTFVDAFGADRAGMGGLLVVLAAGFVAMLLVARTAPRASPMALQIVSSAPVRSTAPARHRCRHAAGDVATRR